MSFRFKSKCESNQHMNGGKNTIKDESNENLNFSSFY